MAANDANSFATQIDFDFKGTRDEFRTIIRVTALQALNRIVLKTPVDTGRARGNWNVLIGTGDEEDAAESDDKTGSEAISRGGDVIGEYAREAGFPVISIYNNLPYIERLEDGYSDQAPEGMVAVTAAELSVELGS